MSTFKSQQQLYDEYITELQNQAPELTDTNEGSTIDALAGASAAAVNEIQQLTVDLFKKTFFDTADGPEITQGADDLENLAVDHFGEDFRRPLAVKATGTVQFTRPNALAGNVTISESTIVKTVPDSNGNSQRYEVVSEVTLVGTSIAASVRALVAGTDGNANAGKVDTIETTLTDPTVVVNNAADFAGGEATQTDAQYRETIRSLIEALRGATAAAITARAITVGGVEQATVTEVLQYVIEYDIGLATTIGDYFPIPHPFLYIADANGGASEALLQDVRDAIEDTRAAGVFVTVLAAVALELDWTANLSLNPGGPNYAVLSLDSTMIKDTMRKYIQDIPIGDDFIRADADAALLASWSADLTDFETTVPSGDVTSANNEKFVAGDINT